MKFKIDENLPVEVAELLRQAGYETATVYDQNLMGIYGLLMKRGSGSGVEPPGGSSHPAAASPVSAGEKRDAGLAAV
jgi:hypothetical protein